jgi:hypothetical protein
MLSGLLLISGLVFAFVMMSNALYQMPGTRVSGVPFAMIVAGLLIPFLAKGRKVLVVESEKGIHKWKPRLVVDKKSRNQIRDLQEEILNVCEKVRIRVMKENDR